MSSAQPRKLIEVALPLPEINDASSYDKMPGIGPHPKGIHHWWARLPLPSARAVLFASVVTDPEDDPAWKNKPAAQQDAERERLFGIVRRLMGKKLHEHPEVYAEARAEMMKHCGLPAPRPGTFCVYVLECEGGSHYIGHTDDLMRRYKEHCDGHGAEWTQRHKPLRIAHFEELPTREEAVKREHDLKTGFGRKWLKDLIASGRARQAGGKLPPVLDPFSGGGSIPLEAARLGFEAHAADLNPVAVLLNKCNLELAPRWANQPPVNPDDRLQIAGTQNWRGTQGLAADVRYYGKRIRERALKKIGKLYPKARLPETHGGGETNVIAWIWARTVASPNPAAQGRHVPIVSTFMLSTKQGKLAWVEPVIDESAPDGWKFTTCSGEASNEQIAKAKLGMRAGKAQDFLCLLTKTPITRDYIQAEGKAGRIRERLMAVVGEIKKGKVYLPPTADQEAAAISATDLTFVSEAKTSFLTGELPNRAGITGGVCSAYGLSTWAHLFTSRQIAGLVTLSDLLKDGHSQISKDAKKAGLGDADSEAYAKAVTTFLALAIDRCADFNCSLSTWKPSGQQQMHLFTRQSLPMAWDFAEANLLGEKAICWHNAVDITADAIESLFSGKTVVGSCRQADAATDDQTPHGLVVCTDPPYYNNIGYAVLSDFFYVWLRRTLAGLYPDVFSTVLVPKLPELTASPSRFDGDRLRAKEHFESGFRKAFTGLRDKLDSRIPLTVYYAFKQEDEEDSGGDDDGEENQSVDLTTGWETLLEALISSGFQITATWPVRASQKWRLVAMNSNALASYIVLACRPRSADAPRVGRNAFVAELKRELPPALRHLQQGNIAPVDFAQAAIGPGMAVFSRYAAVLESSGQPMSVRKALALINGIKDEVLGESIEELDKDTRWAVQWFGEDKFEWGEAGKANLLATAQATAVNGLVAAGILEVEGNRVRLIPTEKLPADWKPEEDRRLTVWEMTHHLIRIYYHEKKGDAVTADLLRRLGNKADVARDLAYKLFTVCEKNKWSAEAQAYNALVLGWPDLVKLAQDRPAAPAKPMQENLL